MRVAPPSSENVLQTGHSFTINEELVWKRFQLGDEDAFAELYKRYVQVIFNYGLKYSEDEALLEDCIHELFLDLWKNRENLSVPNSVRFYLFASIKRRIHKASQKKKEVTFDGFTDLEKVSMEVNPSIEFLMVHDQTKMLQKANLKKGLLLLTANQRKAILLKFYKNLNFQEIALVMDLSIDNVYKVVSRGLVVLRKNVKNLHVSR
jgi:RNA polymerase sigma factor (sigma-70 family)